jgi:RNA polymerase sigma-70 factor (ECF subfamily)
MTAGQTAAVVADFPALVREHQSMVFSIAYHYLHDRSVAEEVAQDVFLQLYRNLPAMESAGHVANWLRKVVTHRSIDAGRRNRLYPRVSLENVPEPAAAARPSDPMLGRRLRQLVASLPEKARMVVVLRYQEDLALEEIAEVLNMPVGTVKSQLQRALALMRGKAGPILGGWR